MIRRWDDGVPLFCVLCRGRILILGYKSQPVPIYSSDDLKRAVRRASSSRRRPAHQRPPSPTHPKPTGCSMASPATSRNLTAAFPESPSSPAQSEAFTKPPCPARGNGVNLTGLDHPHTSRRVCPRPQDFTDSVELDCGAVNGRRATTAGLGRRSPLSRRYCPS
jgi:hypothetical protein